MVSEEKVKLMVQLAAYEGREGKEKIKIGNGRKKDYVGFHMLTSWICITLGYIILIGLYIYFKGEALADSLYDLNLLVLGGLLLTSYLGLMVFYMLAAHKIYTKRYKEARKSMKPYYINLKRLNLYYEKELQKTNHSRVPGGEL